MVYFGHAWCICILPSSCFNLQIHTVKKNENKKNSIAANSANLYCSIQKKEEKKWSWINEVLLWGLDLGALADFVDIGGFGFTTCA